MRESDIQRSIMLATSEQVDWFRNNIGCYDANPRCPHCGARPRDGGPRWIHYGVGGEGGADMIGVLRRDGRFVAAEIKTATGRQSDAQRVFASRVAADGALVVLARSVDDVRRVLP